jgi:hypothetical protein
MFHQLCAHGAIADQDFAGMKTVQKADHGMLLRIILR